MGKEEHIDFSIGRDGTANIYGILPNDKGQVFVPEFVFKNGTKYPVTFIEVGLNEDELTDIYELHLPSSIKDFTVYGPLLKEIHCYGDFEKLSGGLFDCLSLNKVIVHGSVKQIGYGTFKNCVSLKEIIIEKGNTPEIHCSAFMNCSSLEGVFVGGKPISLEHKPNIFCLSAFCGCKSYKYFEGNVVLQDGLLLSLDRTELYTIVGRVNDDGCYKIPHTINDMLHNMAYNGLRSIDFSESQLRVIETDAFNECISLEKVMLPNDDVEIGDRTFLDCKNLKTIINFDKIRKLGIASFKGTRINKCCLAYGISEIPKSVFIDCFNLEDVEIPMSVKTITNNVFEGCSKIRHVKISSGFKESLDTLFKDATDVEYTFFTQSNRNYYRPSGAYTHGDLNCPYCGSSNRTTYIDGTAECHNCGGEYRYW